MRGAFVFLIASGRRKKIKETNLKNRPFAKAPPYVDVQSSRSGSLGSGSQVPRRRMKLRTTTLGSHGLSMRAA